MYFTAQIWGVGAGGIVLWSFGLVKGNYIFQNPLPQMTLGQGQLSMLHHWVISNTSNLLNYYVVVLLTFTETFKFL